MPPELLHLLLNRIETSGPMPFDEFMNLVLYSDPYGYYRNHVPSESSDYRTSPSLTPWFGRLVQQDLERIWRELGSPGEFTVAEVGAGNGDLAASAVDAAEGRFAEALRWVFVEPIDTIARLQKTRFGSSPAFSRVSRLTELDRFTGVVLANEVLDNFAFRIFEVAADAPMEVRVGASQEALQEVLCPVGPADGRLVAPALEHLAEGDRFEVRSGVAEWLRQVTAVLKQGRLLVIDYGDLEPEIWTRRPAGSMVTYRRGELGSNPFENVGEADITAHVDFSEMIRAAQDAGLRSGRLQTQRGWLESLGLRELIAEIRRRETQAGKEGRHGDYLTLMSQRSKVEMLGARGGLGDYLVFTAER